MRFFLAAILTTGGLCVPLSANAELGGPLSTVVADKIHMAARLRSTDMGRYTRHDLTRDNGGAVREFTNADGAVFAVTWDGPGKPDLRTLLGRYFATFQSGGSSTGRRMHGLRQAPQIARPDLQIQAQGHMGWFRGVAFVPSLAPAGFSPSDLAPQ